MKVSAALPPAAAGPAVGCLFETLPFGAFIGAVLGGAGLLKPFAFEPHFVDLGVAVGATVVLVALLRGARGVARPAGLAMALGYASFLAFKVIGDTAAAA